MRTILIVVLAVAVGFVLISAPAILPQKGFGQGSPLFELLGTQSQTNSTPANANNSINGNTTNGVLEPNSSAVSNQTNTNEFGNLNGTAGNIPGNQAVPQTYTPLSLLFIPSVVLMAGTLAALLAYVFVRRGTMRVQYAETTAP